MHDRNMKSAMVIRQVLLILWLLMLCAGCKSMPAQQEESVAPKTVQSGMITGIETKSGTDLEQVSVNATKSLAYTDIKQLNPLGMVVVFLNTTIGQIPVEYTPKSDVISHIKLESSADKKNVRMEIDLARDLPYNITRSGTDLNIIFSKQSTAQNTGAKTAGNVGKDQIPVAAMAQNTGAAQSEPSATNATAEAKEPSPADQSLQQTESGPPAEVSQIDFSGQLSGTSAIFIGTTKPVRYQMKKVAKRRMIFRLFHCTLPESRRNRPLITTRFDSAVDRITPVQVPGKADTVDILIELRQQVPYRIERTNDQLALHFDPSSIGPRPLADANLPAWQQVLDETYQMKTAEPQMAEPQPDQQESDFSQFNSTKNYTGQPIALDFYQTDIRNVFKILQQISGKNYAIDPDVKGSVTIAMEKPVPWDQVLDLILTMNKLGKVENGNIIRIATLSTLQAEESARQQQIAAIQKRKEQQQALEPLVTEYIPINYANARTEILPHISGILTKDRGKVGIDARNNQVIITDTKETIKQAKEIIAQIDKVTPQVIIEARIVEVNDNFTRQIGTTWGAQSTDVYRSDLNGFYGYNVAMNYPAPAANSSVGFTFNRLSSMGTPLVLNATLNAEATTNNLKIISSPKIVTLDNKKATISQGVEYPYQNTTASQGTALQTTQFKKINLTMDVTPHVTPDNRISLKIQLTKDDISQITSTGVPALSTNSAETELLVDDGGTIVIGGVMKTNIGFSERGFPMLRNLPLLGWLFKTTTDTQTKQELLIFMTPRIVQLSQRNPADIIKVSTGN